MEKYLEELDLLTEYISWKVNKTPQGANYSFSDYKKAVENNQVAYLIVIDNLTRLVQRSVHIKGLTCYWHFTTFKI